MANINLDELELGPEEWNKIVAEYGPRFGGFLQSYEWGEFQLSLGRTVNRVQTILQSGLIAGTFIHLPIPGGQEYITCPKGPFGPAHENEVLTWLREQGEGAVFVRVEPQLNYHLLKVESVQPESTVVLDLNQSLEAIEGQMKAKTRYNVRLGEKKGVEVRPLKNKEFGDFWSLMEQTAVRDGIRLHPQSYYRKLLKALNNPMGAEAVMMGAFFEGRLLAVNIIVDFAGVRTYMHGATSNVNRNVMAQYVLHYNLIKSAKAKGLHTFDFWGAVAEEAGEDHPWQGISRYKRGFGGEFVVAPGTFDFTLKPIWYGLYRLGRKINRLI